MDIALNNANYNNLEEKLLNLVNNYKSTNIKKTLSRMFNQITNSASISYVGELNKNDIMF